MKNAFKKIACLLLCLLLTAAVPSAPARAEEAPTLGDLTGDGETTAADAAAMLRALARGTMEEQSRPDLDFTKNGEIDSADVRAALLYAAGGIADWVSFGERVSSGLCSERLFDHFSYTGAKTTESGGYKSDTVAVSFLTGRVEKSNYVLADIYIQDISCFVTAFGAEKFRGGAEPAHKLFERIDGGIVAMNGDYYSIHVFGPVVRNGEIFKDYITRDWDIALLQSDGELAVYEHDTLTNSVFSSTSVYQSWVFGPSLLDEDGSAKTRFRSRVQSENPRSALGYYEPGHYAFLVVDGRSGESKGLTMQRLSQLCEELGFARAYNMDGGQSSILLSQAGVMNEPYHNGRPVSDILAIRDITIG